MRDDLLRHDPTARGPIPKQTLRQAAVVIDESGLVDLVLLWERQDRIYKGGRRPYLTVRATLILWLVLACEHQPMHIRRVEDILRNRLRPKTAAILGIEHDPLAPAEALFERVRNSTRRIIDLFDAYPLPTRQRRLTVQEYQDALEDRRLRDEEMKTKARRAHIFANQMLEATYQMLPAQYRPAQISLAVDATRLKAFARGIGKERLARKKPHEKVSIEPDHGFYLRTAAGTPTDVFKDARVREYALEAEFAVVTSNDPSQPDAVPSLIVAYDQHRPGEEPAPSAMRLVNSLIERGHTIDHFVSDQAYLPGGKPDDLQNPLRALGIKLVMQYPTKEWALGIQHHAHGAIMVDGNWYCPSMAEHPDLINATWDFRKGTRQDEEDPTLTPEERKSREAARKVRWKSLINQRTPFLVTDKEKMDSRGKTAKKCPSAGGSPTASCDLKPNPKAAQPGRILLPIINTPKAPGKLCTNKTSTSFDYTDDGKFGQHYQYGTDEWESMFGYARSQVESANDYVKDDATFALDRPGRRRMRGRAAQAFLQVMTIAAANLQRIRDFLLERDERAGEIEDGITPPVARTRRSRRTSARTRLMLREARMARRSRRGPART
ncbi:hypothetical protein [Microbacterium sp. Leaf320]|uniref:hypothetical protein n=1 Tax=Microbacterium sp. Leaf320 TaxID=1736334 RepID=UPI000A8B2330|nr:hypothetical protein [Microbacterium sp. Leaf320]